MKYIRVKNYEKYQHYKNRNPPWIKLHNDTLCSRTWVTLDNDGRALAVAIMLLASRHNNKIPLDLKYIQRVAYFDDPPDLQPLLDVDFIEIMGQTDPAIADDSTVHQNGVPETEGETEGEGETSMEQSSAEQIRLRHADIHNGYTFEVHNPKSKGLVEGENRFSLSDLPSLPKLTLNRLLYAVFAQRDWWGKLCASAEAVGVSPYQFLGTWRKRFERDAERHMGDAERGIPVAFAAAAEAPQLDSLNVPTFEGKGAFWKYFQSFLLGESGDEAALYVQARRWVYNESQSDEPDDLDLTDIGASVLEEQR